MSERAELRSEHRRPVHTSSSAAGDDSITRL
jgi:hypothetical protein